MTFQISITYSSWNSASALLPVWAAGRLTFQFHIICCTGAELLRLHIKPIFCSAVTASAKWRALKHIKGRAAEPRQGWEEGLFTWLGTGVKHFTLPADSWVNVNIFLFPFLVSFFIVFLFLLSFNLNSSAASKCLICAPSSPAMVQR